MGYRGCRREGERRCSSGGYEDSVCPSSRKWLALRCLSLAFDLLSSTAARASRNLHLPCLTRTGIDKLASMPFDALTKPGSWHRAGPQPFTTLHQHWVWVCSQVVPPIRWLLCLLVQRPSTAMRQAARLKATSSAPICSHNGCGALLNRWGALACAP